MYQSHLTTYFLDGRPLEKVEARLAFGNSGFLFGESVFTTAAVVGGAMTFHPQHLQRLQQNWRWLFGDSLSEKEIGQFISAGHEELVKNGATNDWRLRINIFKDEENRSRCLTIFTPWSFEYSPIENLVVTSGLSKSLAKASSVKQPNYSESFRQKRLSKNEVLFVDDSDLVGETATANIVFLLNDELVTPLNEKGVLKGIGLCEGLKGLDIREKVIYRDDLEKVQGAWLVNSLRGPRGVCQINGRDLDKQGSLDQEIMNCFKKNSETNQVKL